MLVLWKCPRVARRWDIAKRLKQIIHIHFTFWSWPIVSKWIYALYLKYFSEEINLQNSSIGKKKIFIIFLSQRRGLYQSYKNPPTEGCLNLKTNIFFPFFYPNMKGFCGHETIFPFYTFKPLIGFWCPLGLRKFFITMT